MAGTSTRARRLALQILFGMFTVLIGASCSSAEEGGGTTSAIEEPDGREAGARESTSDSADTSEPDHAARQGLEVMDVAAWLRLPVPPDEWSLEDEFAGGFELAGSANEIVIAGEASIWGDDWREDDHFVQNRTQPTTVGLLEGYLQAQDPAVQSSVVPRRLDVQHADEAAMFITSVEVDAGDLHGSGEDANPVEGGTPEAAGERLVLIHARVAAVVDDYGFILAIFWIVEPADADTTVSMVEAMLDGIVVDPQLLAAAVSEEAPAAAAGTPSARGDDLEMAVRAYHQARGDGDTRSVWSYWSMRCREEYSQMMDDADAPRRDGIPEPFFELIEFEATSWGPFEVRSVTSDIQGDRATVGAHVYYEGAQDNVEYEDIPWVHEENTWRNDLC